MWNLNIVSVPRYDYERTDCVSMSMYDVTLKIMANKSNTKMDGGLVGGRRIWTLLNKTFIRICFCSFDISYYLCVCACVYVITMDYNLLYLLEWIILSLDICQFSFTNFNKTNWVILVAGLKFAIFEFCIIFGFVG